MAIERAKEFVEKFYSDDFFTLEALKSAGYTAANINNNSTEDEQNVKMASAANKLGYEITLEEYETASKDFFEALGGWESLRKIFHLAKVAKLLG